jgi:hypothetical protein
MIYLGDLFMNKGNFFYFACYFYIEISQTTLLCTMLLVLLESSWWMSKGVCALSWFHNVSIYDGRVLLNIEHSFI